MSRDRGKTIWSGNEFSNLHIYPGDTIVVPEKTFKPSAMRGVMDWSQMFSQFALGAAAIGRYSIAGFESDSSCRMQIGLRAQSR